MLRHEVGLIQERLDKENAHRKFFSFANTVTTINYQKPFRSRLGRNYVSGATWSRVQRNCIACKI